MLIEIPWFANPPEPPVQLIKLSELPGFVPWSCQFVADVPMFTPWFDPPPLPEPPTPEIWTVFSPVPVGVPKIKEGENK